MLCLKIDTYIKLEVFMKYQRLVFGSILCVSILTAYFYIFDANTKEFMTPVDLGSVGVEADVARDRVKDATVKEVGATALRNVEGFRQENTNFLGLDEKKEHIGEMNVEEISEEIEVVTGLLERHGSIEGMNKNIYSESEREQVNDAIIYLNTLRLVKLDKGLKGVSQDIRAFREDVDNGEYPAPQPISRAEIDAIKHEYRVGAEQDNTKLQEDINALVLQKGQANVSELGL